MAPPNVKVDTEAADSAGAEADGFVSVRLESAGFSAAIASDEILLGEIVSSAAVDLLSLGADISTPDGATSRAGAGALAAPLPDSGDAEFSAVLTVDGGFIEVSAGSADFTVGRAPAVSVVAFADAVLAELVAAATVV